MERIKSMKELDTGRVIDKLGTAYNCVGALEYFAADTIRAELERLKENIDESRVFACTGFTEEILDILDTVIDDLVSDCKREADRIGYSENYYYLTKEELEKGMELKAWKN